MDLLVCSLEDVASVTLRDALLDRGGWDRLDDGVWHSGDRVLYTIDDLHLYHDDVDEEAAQATGETPDRVVFLSRHQSQAGIPSLTVHPLGNVAQADYGGRPETLVPAPVDLLAPMLRGLVERVPDGYEATFEATHHGPHLTTPACFVEIGSDETAWTDREAAEAVVGALLEALDAEPRGPVAVAVGGGHYAPTFTDVARRRHVRLGHIVPSYHLDDGVSGKLARRLAEATPEATGALVDPDLGGATEKEARDALDDAGLDVLEPDELEGQ